MSASLRFSVGPKVFVAGWTILLAALVHIAWHVGRPRSMRLSLDWDFHWLLGLAAGLWMTWVFVRRFQSTKRRRALLAAGVLGLALGQLVQPSLEAILGDVSLAAVYPLVRWSLFAQFSAAWLAGCAVVLVVVSKGRNGGAEEP